ncbi:hypothetical protein SELMODRAFT_122009 [Selaginella moellendorffii]|uniref:Pentacotripeptide-repeat region of PRORP domain-containing protein n=1 Tax=Selaginella moellendorffii TaxID=88036 RepID=D8SP95_SELML|nr:pentatricopeptide repeat-containing protein At1g11290, chloroplastic [Selaginella moellendorffii]EFJ13629.1 hypothetical protein SELMODRAFT_122009 [Selaginella moellendorffii]|eukprot:XP_002985135.1 pentatricopeptide repeat-containing protein At1g11290, chloroplastic [Selaginella moellendorffii]
MGGSSRKVLRLLARIKQDGFLTPDELQAAAAAKAKISRSQALRNYEELREQGKSPSAWDVSAALMACGSYRDLETGQRIHAEIGVANDPKNTIAASLVAMYAKCGKMGEAQRLFDLMGARKKPLLAWNAIVLGYVRAGRSDRALEIFHSMQMEGVRPDERSFLAAIGACASLAVDPGADQEEKKNISDRVRRIHGLLEKKLMNTRACSIVTAALVDAYTKCGSIEEARVVFETMPKRDDLGFYVREL